ncbi:MAG TPA: GNAT family N-acetyltransferase, partial [Roseiflexaceae bacterium]|nr:GNAT family N-acetyltransferase [Roseiflexaceae bacterium]
MQEVREIALDDLQQFAVIVGNAYPSFGLDTPEALQRFGERLRSEQADPLARYYGLYRDGALLGGMRLYDFTMNMRGSMIPAAGVGLVAVDLAHKKQHVARDMIAFFLEWARRRGALLAILYAFRPDFYAQMGFGYAAKTHQYRIAPASLPARGDRSRVRFLGPADREALAACYARCVAVTHGLLAKRPAEIDALVTPGARRIVGYWQGDQLRGYMSFLFQRGANVLLNDIDIRELIYEDRDALFGMVDFLRSQADQIQRIIITTQDDMLHLLADDPRDGQHLILPHVFHQSNSSGIGLMYRALDTTGLLRTLDGRQFGAGTCRLRLVVHDSFVPKNNAELTLACANQQLEVIEERAMVDATITLDVAAFSSLITGAATLRGLY